MQLRGTAFKGVLDSVGQSPWKNREPFLGKTIFGGAATKKRKKGATEQLSRRKPRDPKGIKRKQRKPSETKRRGNEKETKQHRPYLNRLGLIDSP